MFLDLSKLNNSITMQEAEKQPLKAVSGDAYTAPEPKEKVTQPLLYEEIKQLQAKANLEGKKRDSNKKIYDSYQENTRIAGQSKSDILKGLQSGEDIHSLFLKACECISAMTGETVFQEQAAAYINNVYGIAFGSIQPLEQELQTVNSRIDKLCDAIDKEEDISAIQTMQTALYNHLQKRDRLTVQLGRK